MGGDVRAERQTTRGKGPVTTREAQTLRYAQQRRPHTTQHASSHSNLPYSRRLPLPPVAKPIHTHPPHRQAHPATTHMPGPVTPIHATESWGGAGYAVRKRGRCSTTRTMGT